ncbi:hypothetical protein ACIRTB_12120 [Streptomyces sp. NPDC101158]|uniref:DinB/UmuC family translesion DNA polymerase n=1 Tax=Streptomyces sp. NPDC101158 TaxID=3366117 RepID=UPI003809CC35
MTLAVRFADGTTVERTKTMPQASAHTDDLRSAAFRIFDSMAFQRARLRGVTLIAEDLRPADEGPAHRSPSTPSGRTSSGWSRCSTASTRSMGGASPGPPAPTSRPADEPRPHYSAAAP